MIEYMRRALLSAVISQEPPAEVVPLEGGTDEQIIAMVDTAIPSRMLSRQAEQSIGERQ